MLKQKYSSKSLHVYILNLSVCSLLISSCAPMADDLNDIPAWIVMSEQESVKPMIDQSIGVFADQSTSADQSTNGSNLLAAQINFDGTWGLVHRVQSQAEIPVLKQIVTTTITAYLLFEMKQSETGEILINQKTCDIEMYTNSNLGKTEIPKAFIEHLPTTQRTARWLVEDLNHIQFQIDGKIELRGLRSDYPDAQDIPTEPTNDFVVDQDEDGHPGMTVLLTGFPVGEAYVVQRSWDELTSNVYTLSALKTQTRIEGEINWTDEQNVVDASDAILKTPSPKWVHPDAMRRRFAMEKLEVPTCEAVQAIKAGYEIDLNEMPIMP